MKYEYLRQLTIPMDQAAAKKLFVLLTMKGIEVFGQEKESEEYRNLTNEEEAADRMFYVSAADREAAVKIMEESGLQEFISENKKVRSEAEDYLEHAEREYLRKRKITMYESLVVILAALLYYLYRTWS